MRQYSRIILSSPVSMVISFSVNYQRERDGKWWDIVSLKRKLTTKTNTHTHTSNDSAISWFKCGKSITVHINLRKHLHQNNKNISGSKILQQKTRERDAPRGIRIFENAGRSLKGQLCVCLRKCQSSQSGWWWGGRGGKRKWICTNKTNKERERERRKAAHKVNKQCVWQAVGARAYALNQLSTIGGDRRRRRRRRWLEENWRAARITVFRKFRRWIQSFSRLQSVCSVGFDLKGFRSVSHHHWQWLGCPRNTANHRHREREREKDCSDDH